MCEGATQCTGRRNPIQSDRSYCTTGGGSTWFRPDPCTCSSRSLPPSEFNSLENLDWLHQWEALSSQLNLNDCHPMCAWCQAAQGIRIICEWQIFFFFFFHFAGGNGVRRCLWHDSTREIQGLFVYNNDPFRRPNLSFWSFELKSRHALHSVSPNQRSSLALPSHHQTKACD